MEEQKPLYIPDVALESIWLQQNFFHDTSIERRLSPAAALSSGIKHIAIDDNDPARKWIVDSNNLILLYDATLRSLYLRWSVVVNGLNLGRDRYASEEWIKKGAIFGIGGLRPEADKIRWVNIHEYPGNIASELHSTTIPIVAGWGLANIYACVEEMIMLLFKVFYFDSPRDLLQAEEFKPHKAAFKNRDQDPDQWRNMFEERYQQWRFKKIYDGIRRIFTNYVSVTQLKIHVPKLKFSMYADTLHLISLVRNLIEPPFVVQMEW